MSLSPPPISSAMVIFAALPQQDFGYYGGGGQGSRMYKNTQRNFGSGSDLFSEPFRCRRIPGTGRMISVPGMYEAPMYRAARGRSVDDSEAYVGKQTRTRGVPDNSLLKSFAPDKEKASNVAKIKVVVRKRPLNKKELAKNEEDIISVENHANCLTVHETKLKNYETTESRIKREFEAYGPIKRVGIIECPRNGAQGYCLLVRGAKEDQSVSFRTGMAKSVYQWIVKPQTAAVKGNEMFLPVCKAGLLYKF